MRFGGLILEDMSPFEGGEAEALCQVDGDALYHQLYAGEGPGYGKMTYSRPDCFAPYMCRPYARFTSENPC